jgi:hypothetical protein
MNGRNNMQRFRYRHHVQAVQWTGDNEQELRDLSNFIALRRGNSPIIFMPKMDSRLGIIVNEVKLVAQDGTIHPVDIGQWIFVDTQASVRVKDDIPFRIMFDRVPDPIPELETKEDKVKNSNGIAVCPKCSKEWAVPSFWGASSITKSLNRKGKKAKVVCVDCREQEAVRRHQRYQDIPDRVDLKKEIKHSMSLGAERESCKTSKRKNRYVDKE